MFDPKNHISICEKLLSRIMKVSVQITASEKLKKSTRESPWRLDAVEGKKQRSYILQAGGKSLEYEFNILRALEQFSISTPSVFYLDDQGKELGFPFYIREYIVGDSLLKPMLEGESWAEPLYLEAIDQMHSITEALYQVANDKIEKVTVCSILQVSYDYFRGHPQVLADRVYQALIETMPQLPKEQFSNGDLWLDNFVIKGHKLSGIIDFQQASFSDPLYEFLLSFFVEPGLRGRGIEERFCRHIGIDAENIHWYHGLELFETWRWVLESGHPFTLYTKDVLESNMMEWLGTI